MQALRIWALAVFLGMTPGWPQTNGSNGAPLPSAPAPSPAPPTQSRPNQQPGQVLPDSTKLEPVLREKAEYPPEAARAKIQGEVIVKVHVSETGDVDSAEVVRGEPALTDAALEAAKKWKFEPFIRNGKPSRASTLLPFDFALPGNDIVNGASASGKTPGNAPPFEGSSTQSSAAPESAGQPEPGGRIVDVPEAIIERMVTHRVQPVYPYELRARGVQGTVVLNLVISKEGRIEKLEVKSGPKLLIPEAFNAVQLWQFKPYNVAGEPLEIRTTITVKFVLSTR